MLCTPSLNIIIKLYYAKVHYQCCPIQDCTQKNIKANINYTPNSKVGVNQIELNRMKIQFTDSHQNNNTTINALFESNKCTQLTFNTKLERMINWVRQLLNKAQYKKIKDNALIEMKNGYLIRKHFGFLYIPKEYSDKFNIYLDTYFNTYLNFHRSSGYLTGIRKSNKGRSVREYDYYNTPYELFKEKYIKYLKEGLTIEYLDKIAYSKSDYESAQEMHNTRNPYLTIHFII